MNANELIKTINCWYCKNDWYVQQIYQNSN